MQQADNADLDNTAKTKSMQILFWLFKTFLGTLNKHASLTKKHLMVNYSQFFDLKKILR